MKYFALICVTLWSVAAFPLTARANPVGDGTGPKVVADWTLRCSTTLCAASAGLVTVRCEGTSLTVHTLADFRVQHWHNRTAHPIRVGSNLDLFEQETLLSGGQLALINPNEPTVEAVDGVSLWGFPEVLRQMQQSTACRLKANPMGYRALMDDHQHTGRDQLVPFTKPQVEFAVRAQSAATR